MSTSTEIPVFDGKLPEESLTELGGDLLTDDPDDLVSLFLGELTSVVKGPTCSSWGTGWPCSCATCADCGAC